DGAPAPRRRRTRRPAGGSAQTPAPEPKAATRGRGTRAATRSTTAPVSAPAAAPDGEAGPEPKRPARRRSRAAASEDDAGGPTRTRRSRIPGRRYRDVVTPIERLGNKTMLITQQGERDQIAVLEDRLLVEHYITRSGARSMV